MQALYQSALSRPLDANGSNTWGAQLQAVPSTQDVAYDILTSQEAYANLVTAAYLKYLRRPVDIVGLEYGFPNSRRAD